MKDYNFNIIILTFYITKIVNLKLKVSYNLIIKYILIKEWFKNTKAIIIFRFYSHG